MEAVTFRAIKDALDGQNEAFDLFVEKNNKRVDELKSENEKLRDRIEEIESRGSQPRGTGGDRQDPHTRSFLSWMRKRSPQEEAEMRALEAKDITIGSNPGGGFAVPKDIERDIEQHELKISPVRNLVKVVRAGTSDYHHLLSLRGTTSGWSSETGTRSATDTPLLRDVTPTHGELYAYPMVSQWSLDDVFFNLRDWLVEQVSDEFALQTGIAVLTGNGTNKPTGMLNTTPVMTADAASPLRAAAAYQYIACSNSPVAITMDCLITLVYTLNSTYRSGASFIMNSNTAAALRKLKDSTNQYLWQPSNQAGQPDMLLGYPVHILEDLADIGANNFPVGFGNWRRAYLLVDRGPIRIIPDPITTPGQVKFYVSRRLGGHVLNNDAAKFLRTT